MGRPETGFERGRAEMPMRRLTVVCLVVLAAASCASAPSTTTQPSSPLPDPTPAADPVVDIAWPDLRPAISSSGSEPAELMPFGGAPPVWPLTSSKTERIMRGLYRLLEGHWPHFAPVDRRCEGLPRLRPGLEWEGRIGGNQAVEACLRPYLEQLGVGEDALDLFFASGIVIWESVPAGPFWIGRGYDFDMYGSNGASPEYLFTDVGIFDIQQQRYQGWRPLDAARSAAMQAPQSRDLRVAYAEELGVKPKYVGFWNYGESMSLAPVPQRYDGGWSFPMLWSLLGCHACSTPIVGVFAIDVTERGVPIDMRFVELCKDLDYRPNDASDISPERDFGVLPCPGVSTGEMQLSSFHVSEAPRG